MKAKRKLPWIKFGMRQEEYKEVEAKLKQGKALLATKQRDLERATEPLRSSTHPKN